MADTNELLNQIYPLIQRRSDTAFPEFGFKRKGNGWEATTGTINGDKAKGHLHHYDNSPFCFVNVKGGNVSLWDYVQGRDNLSKQDTLKRLAELADYHLPDLNEQDYKRIEEQGKKEELLQAAHLFFKTSLWIEEGKEVLTYLKDDRHYSAEDIEKMDIGFHPGKDKVINHLTEKGYSRDLIDSTGLIADERWGTSHQMVIPVKDQIGRLSGFMTRAISKDIKSKYLNQKGSSHSIPFNSNNLRGKEAIIVEGCLDALFPSLKGISNVVAIGGKTLTPVQFDHLLKRGIKHFNLIPDRDEEGQKGAEKTIDRILGKEDVSCFVITLPEGFKDLDELVREKGIEPFQQALENAESGGKWKAKRIISKHDIKTDKGQQDAVDECVDYHVSDPVQRHEFIQAFCNDTSIPEDALLEKMETNEERKVKRELEREYSSLLRDSQSLLKEGKITFLTDQLKERLTAIELKLARGKLRVSKPLEERLQEKYEREKDRETELLGYRLNDFQEIARVLDGIQSGFYLIGADTNVGKTAFLTNILLDLVHSNKQIRGIYYSFDDPEDVIINRFIAIQTGLTLNSIQRKQQRDEDRKKVEAAYDHFGDLARAGRLNINDLSRVHRIDELEADILTAFNQNKNLVIAIDGLYNFEMDKGYGDKRLESIDRANKVKALSDQYHIPIICTAEVTKRKEGKDVDRGDIMESGKFLYNANLIWILNFMEKEDDKQEQDTLYLKLEYDKNKLSHFRGKQILEFQRKVGKMELISQIEFTERKNRATRLKLAEGLKK